MVAMSPSFFSPRNVEDIPNFQPVGWSLRRVGGFAVSRWIELEGDASAGIFLPTWNRARVFSIGTAEAQEFLEQDPESMPAVAYSWTGGVAIMGLLPITSYNAYVPTVHIGLRVPPCPTEVAIGVWSPEKNRLDVPDDIAGIDLLRLTEIHEKYEDSIVL